MFGIKVLSETRKGEFSIFISVFLWSFFPIFTILTYSTIPPLFSAAFSTFFASIYFAFHVSFEKKWHEIKNTSAWFDIFIATFFIGIIFYGLVFWGLNHTTAGNGSIFMLMEIFFSFLILGLWKKEKITLRGIFGSLIMLAGTLIILLPKSNGIQFGDFIIILATIFAPVGNYYQQKARKKVSSGVIQFIRNCISFIFLLIAGFIFSPFPTLINFSDSLIYLLINGFIFFGLSKIFWIEGIHRIPITKAISFDTIAPCLTMIFAYFILDEVPTIWQIIGIIPIIIGILIILKK